MRRLNIKLRVTLLCTLLAAFIAGTALWALFLGEQRIFDAYHRDALISIARLALDDIRYEDGELEIDRNLDDLPNVRVALFNLDGDLIYGRARFDRDFEHGVVGSARGDTGDAWFVYDTRLDFDAGESLWLRCYMSANTTDSMRGFRRELTAWIFPAMLLLGGLGGFLIARRAFRPVSRIVRTAEGIVDGADLKKRIGQTGARDELYAMASAFDAMFARLDAAFERERRFTADASHELRTPVAGILAQSEFALTDAADDGDRREALLEIHRRAGDMTGLLKRLLLLARMDAQRIAPGLERVDMGMLAEIAAQSMEEAAAARGIALSVEAESVELPVDQTMLLQALLNLIENAIRYGRDGGWVRVQVASTPADVRVCVADDGIGISDEARAHILERFYQADASRRFEGAGLGLSLVERIVGLHGGRVEVESRLNEGSRFTLIFPKKGVSP